MLRWHRDELSPVYDGLRDWPRFVLDDNQVSIQYFDTAYCTQTGHRIADFTQNLRDKINNLLFRQLVAKGRNPPYQTGFELNWNGRREWNPEPAD